MLLVHSTRGAIKKISDVTLEERDNVLYVFCRTNEDISLEWWTFNRDSEYFTEVFGMEIVLVRGGESSCSIMQSIILTVNCLG